MARKFGDSAHPGIFIRENIIPLGMSVTKAAKQLGVGRPALSNLLNCNASLSVGMATKLEKAFGADRQKLLHLQAEYENHSRREEEKVATVHTYVPPFLTIKAKQIEGWADSLDTRQLLPVLLRRLIHTTGQGLSRVDFPGYDDAERRGWDGWTEARVVTPWVPEGNSCWEFGVSKNPGRKADSDYKARTRSTSLADRQRSTFVFVTPRVWEKKAQWINKHAGEHWREVRAYDASDLEQWLEESISAQIWLAEKLGIAVDKFLTLELFWQHWAESSNPSITPSIFEPSIVAHREKFSEWLEGPCERPFVVTADSKCEALAFLACLFRDETVASQSKDLAVVFESKESLRALAKTTSPFIPIVYTEEAERELAVGFSQFHCIIVRSRNAVNSKPDIALDLPNRDTFRKALARMGVEEDEAKRLIKESGCSPTILRRRLSKFESVRIPHWAKDEKIARSLIPMVLTGAWHNQSKADCEVLSSLARATYQEIEENIAALLKLDDCPIWCIGQYRGVASKLDALYAVSGQITEGDLAAFFSNAQLILSEADPALELPVDKRWAAAIYNKVRAYSPVIRENVCETLIILSMHGDDLFHDRLGINVQNDVASLINQLLTPLTRKKLFSHSADLPYYAEAAPHEFLSLLEADLQRHQPVVLSLLEPADSGPFAPCPRTGLLWALECLAWKNLSRVSPLLAKLSRIAIDDNWVNTPLNSLGAIYRSWMPQTAAPLKDRMKALDALANQFPDIGWDICIAQLDTGHQIGDYSYRPRWRSDASGAGQPITNEESMEFERKAHDLVLEWPESYDWKKLCDLVDRALDMPDEDQIKVWNHIDTWALNPENDDNAKAKLCEHIRQFAFTQQNQWRDIDSQTKDRALTAYENLRSREPTIQYAWLFSNHWIDLSSDDPEEISTSSLEKNEEKTTQLRTSAMKKIWEDSSFEGVRKLLSGDSIPEIVGNALARCITDIDAQISFLQQGLDVSDDLEIGMDRCFCGFLSSIDGEVREVLISTITEGMDVDQCVRLLKCAPFRKNTWRLLDRYKKRVQKQYWKEVTPTWVRHDESELIEIIDCLLEAGRPRAAFNSVQFSWPQVETSRLKRLLFDVATKHAEPVGHYKIEAYQISQALNSLDGRAGVQSNEMAQLEFSYIDALRHSEHGIPNLERQISESPTMFVQVLALAYKRRGRGQDPEELEVKNPEQRAHLAHAAHNLLDQITHLPGIPKGDKINADDLLSWITEARQLCAKYDRAEIGDQVIGQILSRAPKGKASIWPDPSICEVMEKLASQHIGRGFSVGTRNQRGACFRGKGGEQERELAKKYKNWARQYAFDYPYVSSVLEDIADSYEHEAEWWDAQEEVEGRLQH